MSKQMLGTILVLNLLIGCATPQIAPIPRGEPVSIVFTRSPEAYGNLNIRNEDLNSNTATGAGTGATGGAVAGAIAGLTCGPFFVFCSPVFAGAGAIVGTVAGAGVGAGVAISGELSDQKAAQLREKMARVQQSRPLQAELQKNFIDRAGKYWKVGTDQNAALVTVELQHLQLSSKRDEQITCTIGVMVSVQRGVAKNSKTLEQKMYQYSTPTSSLSVWLDESNDFIDTVLTSAGKQIATLIVSDLASKDTIDQKNFIVESVESRTSLSAPEPLGSWAGKWKVRGSPVASGVWVLSQQDETVISTGESYYRIRGKTLGDRLDGDLIRIGGSSRDPKLNLVLSSDGNFFEGSIDEGTGINRISGIKVE